MKKRLLSTILIASMLMTSCSVLDRFTDSDNDEIYSRDGDHVTFGHYEQDGDIGNGPEPIEWQIISEEDGKLLLISSSILDCQAFNTGSDGVTWETCTLRSWLNYEFYNAAFDDDEKELISTAVLNNTGDERLGTGSGNDTEDKVFVLSIEEIADYYGLIWDDDISHWGTAGVLETKVTDYAHEEGSYRYVFDNDGGDWWTRSTGLHSYDAWMIDYEGRATLRNYHDVGYLNLGIRPVIYLDIG